MGIVIAFPAERCTTGSGAIDAREDSGSVIILPVIRIERSGDNPTGLEPSSSSPRGKRRKR
jgi:hypothetical protein